MHFCDNCDNMFYIRINGDDCNVLEYYCRNCGNTDTNTDAINICIINKQHDSSNSLEYILNKYTKLDPTLPRVNNINCPNHECKTNTSNADREIIYIRYDNVNMKYLYLCSTCDFSWKK